MLSKQRKLANEYNTSLNVHQSNLNNMRNKGQHLVQDELALQDEIYLIDDELNKVRRTIEYRERSDRVLFALSKHNNRLNKKLY